MKKHEFSRTSIQKILTICEESLDHDISWAEFKALVKETIDFEDKMISFLDRKEK